ncbi:MAG: tRNA uridine-5-carboxymethylaminomethyl(34) synthesis enzyme MnmG, partial [Elusimicrobia bacterium]|nr:tRNA uridine-5-carboxymethylaminomethyl(34) synthesis enzyme MnmG [Elusimicrobiota bacterium]
MNKNFDVIVVGAGHAGVEAAAAVGRSGGNALLISLSVDNLGFLSCNPAVGGVGKGQIVREVDALGGIIGRAADYSGIHFKRLNLSRGAAVRSRRVQVDRDIFKEYVKNQLLSYQGVGFLEGEVSRLIIKNESISGVRLKTGVNIMAPSVVLAPGTFLSGRMFAGLNQKTGGRTGEPSSDNLSRELENIGLNMLKFKTSTCARIRGDSIDFSKLIEQMGDEPPAFFSILSKETNNKQVSCHITHTNSETHRIINDNLDRSPHHTGMIKGAGVRYCPSIEDKLFKFPDAERHQVFLEPESANREIYYPNGIFTSLPEDVQKKFIRSIEGLENAKIFTYGYGIEYNLVNPLDLKHCLETKKISGLFLAGQINGTTGYEEAAGQGLIAGVNALAFARDSEKLILKRDESYIGVMIDDLVTLGTLEPYRMFTSRAEHRLKLRESNVYERLEGIGRKYKVIGEELSRALDE